MSRIASVHGRSGVTNPKDGLWSRRDTTSGLFVGTKATGDAFRSIRCEGRREPLVDWLLRLLRR